MQEMNLIGVCSVPDASGALQVEKCLGLKCLEQIENSVRVCSFETLELQIML